MSGTPSHEKLLARIACKLSADAPPFWSLDHHFHTEHSQVLTVLGINMILSYWWNLRLSTIDLIDRALFGGQKEDTLMAIIMMISMKWQKFQVSMKKTRDLTYTKIYTDQNMQQEQLLIGENF